MAIKKEVIKEIPDTALGPQARNTASTKLVQELRATGDGKVAVTADNEQELDSFYKSLIQWRTRHADTGLHIRRAGDTVYVWIDDRNPVELRTRKPSSSAAQRKATANAAIKSSQAAVKALRKASSPASRAR